MLVPPTKAMTTNVEQAAQVKPATDQTNWFAVIHFYQVFSFICFAGFITFLVLYLTQKDQNANRPNPVIGTGCTYSQVSTAVVRNHFNDPYAMNFDHTTGTAMMATFTTDLITTGGDTGFIYHNFLYTMLDNGTVFQGWEGLTGEVAYNVAFNSNPGATVQQTVLSTNLNVITNGVYFWDISLEEAFDDTAFQPPVVPKTEGGTQVMAVGSVQEWSVGLVVHNVVSDVTDSPPGSQSRVTVLTQQSDLIWSNQILSPLSASTAGLGQYGLNRLSVADETILWGTDPAFLYDYSPSALTWVPADTSTLNPQINGALAFAMPRNGLELFVLTASLQIAQYLRLSHTPNEDASRPDIRKFFLKNTYTTSLASNALYQMRVNETSLIVTDETENVFYYRRGGFGQVLVLDQSLKLDNLRNQAHQNGLIDMTQDAATVTKAQFLSVPFCVREASAECGVIQNDMVAFYTDACS